jgi:phage baseplate assembly protein W
MLPVSEDLSENYEEAFLSSLTWKLNNESMTMEGTIDGIDSVKQAVFCILNTERYEYLIYDWNYGIELAELLGEPISYVLPELKRRISEALEQDDRINEVRDFQFDTSDRGTVLVSFLVETVFGTLGIETEVSV